MIWKASKQIWNRYYLSQSDTFRLESVQELRVCLCKSGPVHFAWDTDFAHLLYVVRHSCTYTKTTIRLIETLYFSEFYGNLISLERRLVVTLFKTLISVNFGGQFTKKTTKLSKKQIRQPCILTLSYLSRRLFKHHVLIKETGRLEWHLIGSLKSHTPKPIKFKVNFRKSEAFLTDPTNIARK